MNPYPDNETWIIESGDAVLRLQAGGVALSPLEQLIYLLWVVDYCMNNAGDLSQGATFHPDWQREAAQLARELSLPFTLVSFSLSERVLEREYYERFDRICTELQHA